MMNYHVGAAKSQMFSPVCLTLFHTEVTSKLTAKSQGTSDHVLLLGSLPV